MIFNSWVYIVFLGIVFLLYWPLPMWGRTLLFILSGAVFYGWWDPRFLGLMAATTSLDYLAGIMMSRPEASPGRRRIWLICSLAGNLGILFFFKYFNFFIGSASEFLSAAGIDVSYRLPEVILPLGISFYTFQSMAYTIDVYRGKTTAIRNPWTFASFVLFFPPMVAGPIERAQHLVPQLATPRTLADRNIGLGLWRILWGLYKKVLIADNLARIVGLCFDAEYKTAGGVILGAVAFTIQIYCDFSGYTDIAIGSAKLLGIDLVENFRLPFFADSPTDFWSRWHISLSTWLRDYLYIPLGGNRHGVAATYRNLMVTMLLGGLWHGASWNFVLWGAYHGALLIAYRLVFGKEGRPPDLGFLGRAPFIALMFVFTVLGFAIFRATQPGQLWSCWDALRTLDGTLPEGALRDSLFLVTGPAVIMAAQEATGNMTFLLRTPLFVRTLLVVFLIGSLALFGSTGGVQFIYFQF
jgi:alginate O-acetyltransferase complex protein AlgI